VEIFIFGYFLVGSFSLLLVVASVIESCSFLFAHNPVVLECLGMATIATAMLSLSKPISASDSSSAAAGKSIQETEEVEVVCQKETVCETDETELTTND
jgi:hypothetical protein